MRDFLNSKANDMTIGQTLGFTALVTAVSFAPFAIAWIAEKLSERRNYYEED